ncbi:MAG: LexA family transcriptional regulator [Clostridiaceae bacterium]|nr:LexA family transcriptional regulator [Clostridiaceae bacterium]
MSIFNVRLRELRQSKKLSQYELSKFLGISKSSVNMYERGEREPSLETLEIIGDFFNVDLDYLLGKSDIKNRFQQIIFPPPILADDTVDIPVIGEIAAGYNILANEEWNGETVSVPASYLKGRTVSDFFVLSVKGSSMYPHYQDGDKVLILKQDHVLNNGDVAAVLYDSECATLKKIEILNDLVRLVPINPEYEPKEIKGADLERYYVLGVPRLLIREIN